MTGNVYKRHLESSSIQGANAPYIEAAYEAFLENPESVDPNWRAYFRGIQDQNAPREQAHSEIVAKFEAMAKAPRLPAGASASGASPQATEKQVQQSHVSPPVCGRRLLSVCKRRRVRQWALAAKESVNKVCRNSVHCDAFLAGQFRQVEKPVPYPLNAVLNLGRPKNVENPLATSTKMRFTTA